MSKKQYTQEEVAAMYEKQNSQQGQKALSMRKEYNRELFRRTGIHLSDNEVITITNIDNGKTIYYMKG